jgi:hypothetical protein
MTTIIAKPNPHPTAANRKIFLSTITLEEYSGEEHNNSEVTRSIIAITASHKLTSYKDKGKIIKHQP